jgi:ribonuclease HI
MVINVYTDGACSNNQYSHLAKAGMGIYFGEGDPRNLSKRINGKQTNNVAELSAIKEVYFILKDSIIRGEIINIYTDSSYSLGAVGKTGKKNEILGWKKNIPNKELAREVYEMYKGKENVSFIHIKAHTNSNDPHSTGNKNADRLAVESIS